MVKDLDISTETKVKEEVNKPMQIMALEAAILHTQNHDKQKKEEERMEEEQERAEKGLDPWVGT